MKNIRKHVIIGSSVVLSVVTFCSNANAGSYQTNDTTPEQSNLLAFNSPIMQNFRATPAKDNTTQKSDLDFMTRLTALASVTINKFQQIGIASWYGRQFNSRSNELTAIHPSIPINCHVRVTNKATGESAIARIVEQKKLPNSRVIDLSYNTASLIGLTKSPVNSRVLVERLD